MLGFKNNKDLETYKTQELDGPVDISNVNIIYGVTSYRMRTRTVKKYSLYIHYVQPLKLVSIIIRNSILQFYNSIYNYTIQLFNSYMLFETPNNLVYLSVNVQGIDKTVPKTVT